MAHFHELCHRVFALRYIRGIPEVRKLDFRGFKAQFDFKKANFRGLIAKIGCLRHDLAFRVPHMAHFHGMYHGNCSLTCFGEVLEPKK